jgi:hypothetical protein
VPGPPWRCGAPASTRPMEPTRDQRGDQDCSDDQGIEDYPDGHSGGKDLDRDSRSGGQGGEGQEEDQGGTGDRGRL